MGDLHDKNNHSFNRKTKKTENSKMAAMAKQSANGNLSSFSGIFSVGELNPHERSQLETLLKDYVIDPEHLQDDLNLLSSITSEVKAINNQAALLHGERIKKAHTILIRYRDGAFTAWLIAAYGNRQTPYNLMRYYEFCEAMPKSLRIQIEAMPRQAIYTLASREGAIEKKKEIIQSYQGETKAELLIAIRKAFPLGNLDKRQIQHQEVFILNMQRLYKELKKRPLRFSQSQKQAVNSLLESIQHVINKGAST